MGIERHGLLNGGSQGGMLWHFAGGCRALLQGATKCNRVLHLLQAVAKCDSKSQRATECRTLSQGVA